MLIMFKATSFFRQEHMEVVYALFSSVTSLPVLLNSSEVGGGMVQGSVGVRKKERPGNVLLDGHSWTQV